MLNAVDSLHLANDPPALLSCLDPRSCFRPILSGPESALQMR